MRNRLSAVSLIFKEDKLLLIKHVHPETGAVWWVPPGGGIKGDESIFDAAKREAFEEAGLNVELGNVIYVRQYISETFDRNDAIFYIVAKQVEGNETIKNINGKGEDEHYIKELKYFSQEELQNETVFPEILKNEMWEDKKENFKHMKFLGIDVDQI